MEFEEAVIHGIGEEDGSQNIHYAGGGEDEEGRDEEREHVAHEGGECHPKQHGITGCRRAQTDIEYLGVGEFEQLAQEGIEQHHGKNLYAAAKGVEERIVAVPAGAAEIVLEEVDDEVGSDVDGGVNQHYGKHDGERLIVLEKCLEHSAHGNGFHFCG